MRLLTIRQPWATLLTLPDLHGRRVESRRFPADYRGRLAIGAGPLDRSALGDAMLRSCLADSGLDVEELPTSGILALATLVDAHQSTGGCCAPWGRLSTSFFHLVLEDTRLLDVPMKMAPQQGMPELTAKEHAQLLTCLA